MNLYGTLQIKNNNHCASPPFSPLYLAHNTQHLENILNNYKEWRFSHSTTSNRYIVYRRRRLLQSHKQGIIQDY